MRLWEKAAAEALTKAPSLPPYMRVYWHEEIGKRLKRLEIKTGKTDRKRKK